MCRLTHLSVATNSRCLVQNTISSDHVVVFSESDTNLVLCGYFSVVFAFVQPLNESINTFALNNTRVFIAYLLIVWKVISSCLFCICCLLALFESNTAVSWTVKHNYSLFILCAANGSRGLHCIPFSAVSFSCWYLLLTELVQTLIIPAAFLWIHSSPWDRRVITSQNTQGAGTWG